MNEREIFGPASGCQSLSELALLQRRVLGDDAKRAIAAYAMVLSGRSAPQGDYFEDALGVLDCLGAAKMELDKSSFHTKPTVIVTATILSETQRFVDEMTIPCTEWPTSGEVVSFIFEIAAKFACAGPWKRTVVGLHGQVTGIEEFDRI
ncbi:MULTISPECIES: hypothetical protein [unclassified Pseudomonas]|uniref:hypothetical protein n=1 Tax=unclassified Pseudomonas TaxID=196821 RepID=UPI0011972245|nr:MULTISPECIES: hypothetical protein [unclassified Pseudomonas]MCP1444793.1 hypothetical protein [Pseudomonas sp. GGS8]TVT80181.1 hypothetical protein FPT12_24040 [Pseudomonas sp. H3(2019)]